MSTDEGGDNDWNSNLKAWKARRRKSAGLGPQASSSSTHNTPGINDGPNNSHNNYTNSASTPRGTDQPMDRVCERICYGFRHFYDHTIPFTHSLSSDIAPLTPEKHSMLSNITWSAMKARRQSEKEAEDDSYSELEKSLESFMAF